MAAAMTLLSRVADGPINGTGWYILDNAPRELLAPGGVVLCHDQTLVPHTGAQRAAQSAWELLQHWRPDKTPPARMRRISGRAPVPRKTAGQLWVAALSP